ncbi:phage tail protein [Domibacillus indicus]|uniref:phage tail protein n=1 Tax=Domibacillus indicus TaxID=1437523 RepID=UPI00203E96FD|nr:phage tail protein [Domibacillus indicus]MCM3789424.1 phage tail protein [Domibacillus indicus]
MAGTYTQGQHKDLSGVYSTIQAVREANEQGTRGIVAYPFTSDWGPVNVLTDVSRDTQFDTLFNGSKTALTAKRIYNHAFRGNPYIVLAYRMASTSAKVASITLTDGAGTPATSLIIDTLYPTTRPFVARVIDTLSGGKRIEFTENGSEIANVEGSSVVELREAIDATNYFRVRTAGANLPANNAGVTFAGGHNGQDITASQHLAFRTEIEADGRAKAIAMDDYTDAAEVATYESWLMRARANGAYITFVNGGPASWETNQDVAHVVSREYNNRSIVNVAMGVDGYPPSEIALFIAARVASVALNRSITDETIPYDKVNKKLTPDQRIAAKRAGTLVLVQNGDTVEIDEGVNTFTVVNDPENEREEFGKIRVSNTLDQIAADTEKFGQAYKKNKNNTVEARVAYGAAITTEYFGPMITQEVLHPGATYAPDPEWHGENAAYTPKIDEAYFASTIQPIDSMEKIYQKFNVSFSA